MRWYIAKIVFKICADNQTRDQFDEQIRLVMANDMEEAFIKARTIGLNEEDLFFNDKQRPVKWEFINVADLNELQELSDGAELASRIYEMDEARSYVQFIHQKAIALRMSGILN